MRENSLLFELELLELGGLEHLAGTLWQSISKLCVRRSNECPTIAVGFPAPQNRSHEGGIWQPLLLDDGHSYNEQG